MLFGAASTILVNKSANQNSSREIEFSDQFQSGVLDRDWGPQEADYLKDSIK